MLKRGHVADSRSSSTLQLKCLRTTATTRQRAAILRSRKCLRLISAHSATVEYPGKPEAHTTDVVVIGAGIGGLSCAAMLAKYGLDVTVLESHSIPGGAAHVRPATLSLDALSVHACMRTTCRKGFAEPCFQSDCFEYGEQRQLAKCIDLSTFCRVTA